MWSFGNGSHYNYTSFTIGMEITYLSIKIILYMWNKPRYTVSGGALCAPMCSRLFTILSSHVFTDATTHACSSAPAGLLSLFSSYWCIFPLPCIRINISSNIASLWRSLAFYSVSQIPCIQSNEAVKGAELTLIQGWQWEEKEQAGTSSPPPTFWGMDSQLSCVLVTRGQQRRDWRSFVFWVLPIPTGWHPGSSTWCTCSPRPRPLQPHLPTFKFIPWWCSVACSC